MTTVLYAESPPPKAVGKPPTLNEFISDPKYLRASLAADVLLATDETGKVAPEFIKAIEDADLNSGIQFYPLPKEATRPVPKVRVAPDYPRALREKRISGEARFLFVIGADGAVKGIYCCKASNSAFALSGATALAKWKFTSAKIQSTAVPILAFQTLEFSAGD